MSLIDNTYFVGEIAIPQASTDTNLTQAITQYEKEILISLLGYKLYSLLIVDVNAGLHTKIYQDLVNGAEFTLTFKGVDYLLKWEGLKNTSSQSLITYYVYFKFIERDITRLYGTGISMAVPAGNNSGWERVSAVNKLCSIWERVRELYGKIPAQYKRYFNPIIGVDTVPAVQVFNYDPSAYNFLYVNKDDYPDWIFTPLWNINAFGI
jgi:hypothetical protein